MGDAVRLGDNGEARGRAEEEEEAGGGERIGMEDGSRGEDEGDRRIEEGARLGCDNVVCASARG